ncbi:MAG: DUF1844 domain-containing protein [Candidatus Atribacteria bacterium]|jgi:hypothetical protein|nr:DUF1844 domain-containing protein [Candidatus Atribacteria bacterium]
MDNKEKESPEKEQSNEQKIYPHQLPLATLLVWFIGILNSKAWEDLGLISDPDTGEVKQDFKRAKISIDSVEFLLNQIKDELESEDKKQIENLLANLRMNYVEKYEESQKSAQPDQGK